MPDMPDDQQSPGDRRRARYSPWGATYGSDSADHTATPDEPAPRLGPDVLGTLGATRTPPSAAAARAARPVHGRDPLDALADELGTDPGIADALDALALPPGPRFRATFTKLSSHGEFSADELAMVLDLARYSLEDVGELTVIDTARTDPVTWQVTYALGAVGPMGEMMLGPVGGVMAAWRGKLPIPQVGLVAAEGEMVTH